jgi:hypothetical protein
MRCTGSLKERSQRHRPACNCTIFAAGANGSLTTRHRRTSGGERTTGGFERGLVRPGADPAKPAACTRQESYPSREKNLEVEFEATPGFRTLGILTHVCAVPCFALFAGSR